MASSLPFGYSLRSPSPLFVDPHTPSSSSSSPPSTTDYPIKVEDYISNSQPFASFLSVSSSSSSTPNSMFGMPSTARSQGMLSRQQGAAFTSTPPRRRSPLAFHRDSDIGDGEEERRRKRRRIQPDLHSFDSFLEAADIPVLRGQAHPWLHDTEYASSAAQPDVIDLTDDVNQRARHTEREVQAAETLESLRRKGRPQYNRVGLGAASSSNLGSRDRPILLDDADEIELDMTRKVEARQEFARQQELAAIEASKREGDKRITFNSMNCVICMDMPTDLTMAACGHVFCHVCINEALKHSENQQLDRIGVRKAKCPVCRKTINRKGAQSLVPLLIMKGSRKDRSRMADFAEA